MDREIFYLCDHELACSNGDKCIINGGECAHTKDIDHAANFLNCCGSYIETNIFDNE